MQVQDYGPFLTAEAFLEVDFGERIKAELEDGEIRVLERGPRARVHVADNLLVAIGTHLRGSGKRAYGSSLALKTGKCSVRHPDVAVYEGELARVFLRRTARDWEETLVARGRLIDLPPFGLAIPHATIFTED